MTGLYEFLISLAIVAVLFVTVGVFLPSERSVSQSVETNRPQTIVFDVSTASCASVIGMRCRPATRPSISN